MRPEERTFVAIKPDGVKRGLIGKILTRFEEKGFKIVGMKLLQVTPELAAQHYAEHVGKSFYNRLIYYITSAPIVAMVVQGYNAVESVRHMVGATNPLQKCILHHFFIIFKIIMKLFEINNNRYFDLFLRYPTHIAIPLLLATEYSLLIRQMHQQYSHLSMQRLP